MSKRGKKYKQIRPVKIEAMPKLDLGFLNASPVRIPGFKFLQILVVGCGGIGAYMVQHIGRLMHVLYRGNKGIHLTVVDPDIVKEENIGRQLFCAAEIGVPKAEALARRYGHAWGLNVSSCVGEYDDSLLFGADLTVLVGCVDGAPGRRAMNDTLSHNGGLDVAPPKIWWLDCGNLHDTGRVLLGSANNYEQVRGSFVGGECIALPGPALQSLDLLIPAPDELADNEMSCAELAAANLQSLNINARIAAEAADFITRLLVTKDLKRFGFEINLAAGSAKSFYNTPEEVARVIRKPVVFVQEKSIETEKPQAEAAHG